MRKAVPVALTLALLGLTTPASAQLAGRCQDLDPAQDGDADRAFACIAALETQLDELMTLFAAIDHRHAPEIPSGAVLAFDRSNGCPPGWASFKPGQGRVLVGVTTGEGLEPRLDTNENGEALAQYKYRDHGGVETVTLAEEQIPSHQHITTPPVRARSGGDWWYPWGISALGPKEFGQPENEENFSADYRYIPVSHYPMTSPVGEGAAHANMPPYLALHFCRKD